MTGTRQHLDASHSLPYYNCPPSHCLYAGPYNCPPSHCLYAGPYMSKKYAAPIEKPRRDLSKQWETGRTEPLSTSTTKLHSRLGLVTHRTRRSGVLDRSLETHFPAEASWLLAHIRQNVGDPAYVSQDALQAQVKIELHSGK